MDVTETDERVVSTAVADTSMMPAEPVDNRSLVDGQGDDEIPLDNSRRRRRPVIVFDPSPAVPTPAGVTKKATGKRPTKQASASSSKRSKQTRAQDSAVTDITPPFGSQSLDNEQASTAVAPMETALDEDTVVVLAPGSARNKAAFAKLVTAVKTALQNEMAATLDLKIAEMQTGMMAEVLTHVRNDIGPQIDALKACVPKPLSSKDFVKAKREAKQAAGGVPSTPVTTALPASLWDTKLDGVLARYNSTPSWDKVLVSDEIADAGTRQFIVWTTEKFRNASVTGDRHFYELVPANVP
ncbi:hypothetical protein HDU96_003774 [Phlyctochytrium bullatum]|nr:hypothetical protein HDU96_003774 [Phlyctochytrium bullatum]